MHADTLDAVDAWQDISDAKALASLSLHVIIIYCNQLFHVSSNVCHTHTCACVAV